ncbi:MAG: sigma-70 family RNA polymerase sigma factor [Sarcina sp.]
MIKAEDNLGLAVKIASKYFSRGDREDIIQMAYEGLVKATKNFDESLGYKFSTYASIIIEGEVRRWVRDGAFRTQKVPRTHYELYCKIITYLREINVSFEDVESHIEHLAEKYKMTTYNMRELLYCDSNLASINVIVGENKEDIISTKGGLDERFNDIFIEQAIGSLKGNERYVIEERYLKGRFQQEVALDLGISQVSVSRIEKRALVKLKRHFMR